MFLQYSLAVYRNPRLTKAKHCFSYSTPSQGKVISDGTAELGIIFIQQDLGCMTEKLKEPADQLKYYSSKYVWMTAKVLELFCHEICF